jgi:hypothetical protein
VMSRSRSCKGRSMRILVGTRMLRSLCPSLVWDRFWVPGCSPGFGDGPEGYADAKSRKNYAGTTPDHPRLGQEEGRDRPICTQ